MNLTGVVLGSLICLASIIAYIPQFYNIIKNRSVEGISELSLILLNFGLMCLTMNSLIYSWASFFSTNLSDVTNIFPFIQILVSWIMVLVYYIIFITYKFKKKKRRILFGLQYLITYFLFAIFIVGLALAEKLKGDLSFFIPYADVLGYSSAVLNSLVYLPQIYKVYKIKSPGRLSFVTYFLQTPGNIVIIVFQSIIYSYPISTWITYVFVTIEQSLILSLMLVYYFKNQEILNNGFENFENCKKLESVEKF